MHGAAIREAVRHRATPMDGGGSATRARRVRSAAVTSPTPTVSGIRLGNAAPVESPRGVRTASADVPSTAVPAASSSATSRRGSALRWSGNGRTTATADVRAAALVGARSSGRSRGTRRGIQVAIMEAARAVRVLGAVLRVATSADAPADRASADGRAAIPADAPVVRASAAVEAAGRQAADRARAWAVAVGRPVVVEAEEAGTSSWAF